MSNFLYDAAMSFEYLRNHDFQSSLFLVTGKEKLEFLSFLLISWNLRMWLD